MQIGIFQEKIGRYAFLSCSSELGIWGAHPSDGCLKIRDARCGVRALQFSEAWNWEFHLIIWHCVKDVVYGKNVTVPFLPASVWVIRVFSPLPDG